MDAAKLAEVLEAHVRWVVRSETGGVRADLSGADLTGASLGGADLTGAPIVPRLDARILEVIKAGGSLDSAEFLRVERP